MSKVISITNQKGGVAKTTTAIHLAVGLAMKLPEARVLLVDLDSQRNATSVTLKKANFPLEETVYPLFQSQKLGSKQLHATSTPNLTVVPASLQLVEIDSLLANALDGFFRFNEGIEKAKNEFEYIILDCPPSLSVITISAMVAARYLLIPVQISKFSIDGIQGILDAIVTVKKRYNPHLEIMGGLLTMYNPRTTLSKVMRPEISKHMHLFETAIPKSVSVEEAHMLKQDLFTYAPKSKATLAYRAFVDEVHGG